MLAVLKNNCSNQNKLNILGTGLFGFPKNNSY